MKIILTGGGTGGHFYPIIAVAEELRTILKEHNDGDTKIYFMAPEPYDEKMLTDNGLIFKAVTAGKLRKYFSLQNILDSVKTILGSIKALVSVFVIFPDVIFGKGGYASFPVLFAARILHIPVIIHESDSVPGRVNKWAGKFAKRIALSYPEAADYFSHKDRIAVVGNPVRKSMRGTQKNIQSTLFVRENSIPTILILGGSQGSKIINEAIINILFELVDTYQIIHQTGKGNFVQTTDTANLILDKSSHADRYKAFDYLSDEQLEAAVHVTDLVISRAGSTIFEIASWQLPSILIPITGDGHQRTNAFSYAKSGASIVIEEKNLTPHVVISEIERILSNPQEIKKMKINAGNFFKPDAAKKIAEEILNLGKNHR